MDLLLEMMSGLMKEKMFSLIGRIIKPGDKLTESQANILSANGLIIENNEIIKTGLKR